MQLDFGFVSICLSEKDCSPAGNVTVKQVKTLEPEQRRARILRVAKRNLENTLRIMWFLDAHGFKVYRLSANLVPLATHEITRGWAWWEEEELLATGARIGQVAREKGYRLSSHLPELCGLTGERTFYWAEQYLEYHRHLFELLGLDRNAKIILHLGGAGKEKREALQRARRHIEELSSWARERIVLENDDRVFTAKDVVQLAEETGVPVVFDWHHHWVKHDGDRTGPLASELIARAAGTWQDRPAKVHLSSPKSAKQQRAHADFVDVEFVVPFFQLVRSLGLDHLDIMVEAKMKDLAALKLGDDLKALPDLT